MARGPAPLARSPPPPRPLPRVQGRGNTVANETRRIRLRLGIDDVFLAGGPVGRRRRGGPGGVFGWRGFGFGLGALGLHVGVDLAEGDEAVAFVELDQPHAGGVAAGLADLVDAGADEDALLGDEHDLVAVDDEPHADDIAVAVVGVDVDDAAGAAALDGVVGERRPLAVALDAGGQYLAAAVVAIGDDDHADDLVAVALEPRAGHAAGRAAHGADLGLLEPDGQAALGAEDDVVLAAGDVDADQLVAVLEADRDDAGVADVAVGAERGLLHDALVRREHQEVLFLAEVLDREHVRDLLAGLELQELGDRPAHAGAASLRDLVDPPRVNAALVREEQEVVVGVGDEQVLDEVAFAGFRPLNPAAAAALAAVGADRQPLDVPFVRHGDDHVLGGDQVLEIQVGRGALDARPAFVAVLLLHLVGVLADDVEDHRLVPEDRLVPLNLLDQRAVLVDQLLDLQPDELDQLQGADRLGLRVAEQDWLGPRPLEQVGGNPRGVGVALGDAEGPLPQSLDRLLA